MSNLLVIYVNLNMRQSIIMHFLVCASNSVMSRNKQLSICLFYENLDLYSHWMAF